MKVYFLFVFFYSLSLLAAPNPASVACSQNGGKSFSGMELCFFGASGIQEFTLFRYQSGDRQAAVDAFLAKTSSEPGLDQTSIVSVPSIEKICKTAGGKLEIQRQPDGYRPRIPGVYIVCNFSDGSAIDALALYKGSKHPDNADLVKALQIVYKSKGTAPSKSTAGSGSR
jgi:putative hemolysin